MNEYNRWQKKSARPRALRIKQMLKDGLKWKEIAKRLSISRQRAQQIYARISK